MTTDHTSKSIEEARREIVLEISGKLAERRKKRQINLETVSQTLKIRIPYLKAMENGEWDDLPGEVYLRGFLMRYAQYLGLNGAQLLTPYLALGKNLDESDEDSREEIKEEKSSSGWIWVGLAVLLFVGLIKFLKPENRNFGSQPDAESSRQIQNSSGQQSGDQPATDETENNPSEDHEIEIYTPHPLWLRIQSPEDTFEGFIPQETTWSWSGKGELSVRLGHTREVALVFDGKKVALGENQKRVILPYEN